MTDEVLLVHSDRRIARSEIVRFGTFFGRHSSATVTSGADPRSLALNEPERFRSVLWDHMGDIGEKGQGPSVFGDAKMTSSSTASPTTATSSRWATKAGASKPEPEPRSPADQAT